MAKVKSYVTTIFVVAMLIWLVVVFQVYGRTSTHPQDVGLTPVSRSRYASTMTRGAIGSSVMISVTHPLLEASHNCLTKCLSMLSGQLSSPAPPTETYVNYAALELAMYSARASRLLLRQLVETHGNDESIAARQEGDAFDRITGGHDPSTMTGVAKSSAPGFASTCEEVERELTDLIASGTFFSDEASNIKSIIQHVSVRLQSVIAFLGKVHSTLNVFVDLESGKTGAGRLTSLSLPTALFGVPSRYLPRARPTTTVHLEPHAVGGLDAEAERLHRYRHGTALLNDGTMMPLLGFGTWYLRGEECEKAVKDALHFGIQRIDTAGNYGNERNVGNALRGAHMPREELYVATMLEPEHYESVRMGVESQMRSLGVSYLDLYLVHGPPTDAAMRASVWREMEKLVESGLVRSIGVSNYNLEHLQEMEEYATMFPAVLQVKHDPYHHGGGLGIHPVAVEEWCRSKSVLIESYSPLSGWPFGISAHDDVILDFIGSKYGMTAAQVTLRWIIQRGVAVITRSKNTEHIEQAATVGFFELSDEDVNTISSLAWFAATPLAFPLYDDVYGIAHENPSSALQQW